MPVLVVLAFICAIIAGFFTMALYQFMRGIKTHNRRKVILGVILFFLTMVIVYYTFMSILLAGAQ